MGLESFPFHFAEGVERKSTMCSSLTVKSTEACRPVVHFMPVNSPVLSKSEYRSPPFERTSVSNILTSNPTVWLCF